MVLSTVKHLIHPVINYFIMNYYEVMYRDQVVHSGSTAVRIDL